MNNTKSFNLAFAYKFMAITSLLLFQVMNLHAQNSDKQAKTPSNISSTESKKISSDIKIGKLGNGLGHGILSKDAKISFIASSYMGAYGGLNNYVELVANHSTSPILLNTIPARTVAGGWYWGMGLKSMTSALDRIEKEGGYNVCIFQDGPIETMINFANRLFNACDHVVLFSDAGGHNPVSLGDGYFNKTATTLKNARIMQAKYPKLLVIPTAYIFYDLTINPLVNVPRLDYLYGDKDIHQNGLGTLVNAFSMYSVLSSRPTLGIVFEFDKPTTDKHKFMDGDFVLIGHRFPQDTPNDKLLFDESTQHLFQKRIFELLIKWNHANTVFD